MKREPDHETHRVLVEIGFSRMHAVGAPGRIRHTCTLFNGLPGFKLRWHDCAGATTANKLPNRRGVYDHSWGTVDWLTLYRAAVQLPACPDLSKWRYSNSRSELDRIDLDRLAVWGTSPADTSSRYLHLYSRRDLWVLLSDGTRHQVHYKEYIYGRV